MAKISPNSPSNKSSLRSAANASVKNDKKRSTKTSSNFNTGAVHSGKLAHRETDTVSSVGDNVLWSLEEIEEEDPTIRLADAENREFNEIDEYGDAIDAALDPFSSKENP